MFVLIQNILLIILILVKLLLIIKVFTNLNRMNQSVNNSKPNNKQDTFESVAKSYPKDSPYLLNKKKKQYQSFFKLSEVLIAQKTSLKQILY